MAWYSHLFKIFSQFVKDSLHFPFITFLLVTIFRHLLDSGYRYTSSNKTDMILDQVYFIVL